MVFALKKTKPHRSTNNTAFSILKYQRFSLYFCEKNIILGVIQEYFHCYDSLTQQFSKSIELRCTNPIYIDYPQSARVKYSSL